MNVHRYLYCLLLKHLIMYHRWRYFLRSHIVYLHCLQVTDTWNWSVTKAEAKERHFGLSASLVELGTEKVLTMESSGPLQMLPFPPPQTPDFPFFGIGALILIYALLLYLFVDLNYPLHSTSSTSPNPDRLTGLSFEEIEDLPCFDYGVNTTNSVCAVCLDGISKGDRCRRFPGCNHVFHVECIDLWLLRRLTCPTCRSSIKTRVVNSDIV